MKKWILFAVIALVVFGIDQLTKTHFMATMTRGETINIFGEWFSWHLTFNKGALFGMNPANFIPGLPTDTFFYIFNAIALTVLVNYVRTTNLDNGDPMIMLIGLSTVTGGALGNLTDRILASRDGVVDFIMVDLGFSIGPIPFDPWPIFNVADIGVTCGVVMILIGSWLESHTEKNPML